MIKLFLYQRVVSLTHRFFSEQILRNSLSRVPYESIQFVEDTGNNNNKKITHAQAVTKSAKEGVRTIFYGS